MVCKYIILPVFFAKCGFVSKNETFQHECKMLTAIECCTCKIILFNRVGLCSIVLLKSIYSLMGNEPISLNCSDQLKIKKKCILKIERFGKTIPIHKFLSKVA